MQLYRGVLKQAWQTTWKSKYLWFFGLFAALLGNGGEYEILVKVLSGNISNDFLSGIKGIIDTGIFTPIGISNIGRLLIEEPISVIISLLILLVMFILFCFIVWLVNVSQAVLVDSTLAHISKKNTNFQKGLAVGMKKFWPVFGLNVISRFIIVAILALISYVVVLFNVGVSVLVSSVVYAFIFIFFIPLAMSFSFIVKYGIGYAVIQNLHFTESLRSGWQLFKKNWLISLEMAFVLYFINIIVTVMFLVVLLVLAIPFAFLVFLAMSLQMVGMSWFIISFALILFFALVMTVGAVLSTFQVSSWTTLFIELIGRGGKSKLERLFSK